MSARKLDFVILILTVLFALVACRSLPSTQLAASATLATYVVSSTNNTSNAVTESSPQSGARFTPTAAPTKAPVVTLPPYPPLSEDIMRRDIIFAEDTS